MIILTSFASSLTLYTGVPLDNTYENTYTTTSLLSGFTHDTIGSNYYRIRPDKNTVKIEHSGNMNVTGIGGTTLNLYSCNYMSFINGQHENRRFYCFITDVRYISDYTAEIDFEVDVMMTWLKHGSGSTGAEFDTCFIERQHTDSDEIGEHILDEGIEYGEYIYDLYVPENPIRLAYCLYVAGVYTQGEWVAGGASYRIQVPNDSPLYSESGISINSRGSLYIEDVITGTNLTTFPENLDTYSKIIRSLGEQGKENWIIGLYIIPYASIGGTSQFVFSSLTHSTPTRPLSIDGYTPKNKKLFTFPYVGCAVTNYEGQENLFAYELSSNQTESGYNYIKFEIVANFFDGTASLYPTDYSKGQRNNVITKTKYPVMATSSNAYNTYQAQIKSTASYDFLSNAAVAGGSALIGGGPIVGGIQLGMSAFNQINNIMRESALAELKGTTVTGQNAGFITMQNTTYDFGVYNVSIREEYAKSIDSYFTKFGYKVNVLAKPSMTYSVGATRPLDWKYIKTIGCALNGDCPSSAQSKICEIMDNGITFWSVSGVGNYTFPTQGGE